MRQISRYNFANLVSLLSERPKDLIIPLMHSFVEYGFQSISAVDRLIQAGNHQKIVASGICSGPVCVSRQMHVVAARRPSQLIGISNHAKDSGAVAIDERLNFSLPVVICVAVIWPPHAPIDWGRPFQDRSDRRINAGELWGPGISCSGQGVGYCRQWIVKDEILFAEGCRIG